MIKFTLVAENEEGEKLFESSASTLFHDVGGNIEIGGASLDILFSRAYSLVMQTKDTKQKELDSLKGKNIKI